MQERIHIMLNLGLAMFLVAGTGTAHGWAEEPRSGFPARLEAEGERLRLAGTGLLRYKRIIPVYDAALYLGAEVRPEQALEDVPKRIEVRYRVGADAERFTRAGDDVLARAFSEEELAGIRARLEELNSWYPDPEPGDRCAITYVPGRGTELEFNGRSMGRIEGEDFARMYFAIWLGDEPASKALRRDLLGQEG